MLAQTKAWGVPMLLWFAWSGDAHAVQNDLLAQLVQQKRYAEVSRVIDARLARDGADPAALAASVDIYIARNRPDDLPLARAMGERCATANPASSLCAEALGNALTAQKLAGGLVATIGNARAIRNTFERAVRFDPMNYRARVALVRFHLSTSRARELATEARRTEPNLTRLIRALCALNDKKLDEAEQYILAADLTRYPLVRDSQRDVLMTLAGAYLDTGHYDDSRRLFEELSRRVPSSEHGLYGLALVAQAQGRLADAVRYLEQAAAIEPRPFIYRTLGDIHQARQDGPRAVQAYQAALSGIPPLTWREQRQVTAHLAQLQAR
jgi:tetratricopeptide (TPR) repeat protein